MTRKKRSRKSGPLATSAKDTQRVREERAGREKKKAKPSGGKAGSRQQTGSKGNAPQQASKPGEADSRVGSKKPIKLITPGSQPATTQPKPARKLVTQPLPDDLPGIQQQLLALEEDEGFMAQLEIVDEGGILPPAQQDAFEQKLQRYEQLLERAEQLDEADDPLASLLEDGAGFKDDWS